VFSSVFFLVYLSFSYSARGLLRKALEYQVTAEHSEDGYEFMEDKYGRDYSFADLLISFAHIFTQEDKAWLLEVIEHCKASRGTEHSVSTFEIIGTLEECFKVEASGWDIASVSKCQCEAKAS